MADDNFGNSSRRKFVIASGAAAGTALLGGCLNDGNGNGDGGGGGGNGDGGGSNRLSMEGSSTVYPIAKGASSYWNSNAPASDEEYWGPSQYGYDTDMNLADYWAQKYGFEPTGKQANPPFFTTVGLSHSGTGVKSVKKGLVDIGNSSAPVKAELNDPSQETLNSYKDHVVARDGQPIVVSKQIKEAGVTELTGDQVAAIYKGEITNWSEIDAYDGPDKEIYAVGRAKGSGTDTAFRLNMYGDPNAKMPGIDTRKGQNQGAKKVVANSDNAICYIALAFVGPQTPAIALTFEGTTYELGGDPGLGAEDYPLNRDLHMYTWKDTSKMESAFINFILSEMGQQIFVAGNNYFKLPESEREDQRAKLADQV